MTTKVQDVISAEQQLEGAEAELARYSNDPSQWSASESMDPQGRRALNITPLHYERVDALKARVEAARRQLVATKRAFLDGVLDGGGAGDAAG